MPKIFRPGDFVAFDLSAASPVLTWPRPSRFAVPRGRVVSLEAPAPGPVLYAARCKVAWWRDDPSTTYSWYEDIFPVSVEDPDVLRHAEPPNEHDVAPRWLFSEVFTLPLST